MKKMLKYPLIRSFIIFSFSAFILTGFVLSSLISNHIKQDAFAEIIEITRLTVKAVIIPQIGEVDFSNPIETELASNLQSDISDALKAIGVQSMALINTQNEIVMSDHPEIYEEWVLNNSYLNEVLISSQPYMASSPYESSEILVYDMIFPVILNEGIIGVFVIQISSDIIFSHVRILNMTVVLTLFGGLLVLFLLLNGILFKTSKTIMKQNIDLKLKKEELETSYNRLNHAYLNTINALSSAVDARDPYTAGHSSRATNIALLLGNAVHLSESDLHTLELASLFHDIGKIGVPDQILNKIGKLTNDEFAIIKKHPETGVKILSKIEFLKAALPIIHHHHERFSGKGYPDGICGDEIPIGARILALADSYDAMTSDRPYRKALTHQIAVQEIREEKGSQFDPSLVDVFFEIESEIKKLQVTKK